MEIFSFYPFYFTVQKYTLYIIIQNQDNRNDWGKKRCVHVSFALAVNRCKAVGYIQATLNYCNKFVGDPV